MNIHQINRLNYFYALSGILAFALWQYDHFILSAILLLLAGGVAVARPHIENTRLILDGTPVLLLFAVLFISASGMVVAVDQISAFFTTTPADSCDYSVEARKALIDIRGES